MKEIKPRNLVKEDHKFKLDELNKFVKINAKGVYYIEDNLMNNKFSRYYMFLRMKNVDLNKLFDSMILIEKNNSNG